MLAAALAACTTVRRDVVGGGSPPPEPRAPQATPLEAPVNAVALVFGPKPVDLDGDGIADLVELDAYLYSRPYAMSYFAPGTLEFEIFAPGTAGKGGKPLGSWRFAPPQLASRADVTVFGPCYRIKLDLREIGLAPFPISQGDLRCRFLPASGGSAVESRGVERIAFRG
jgi:hypothetical protein